MKDESILKNLDKVSAEFVKNLNSDKKATPLYELTSAQARQFLLDLQRKYPVEVEAEIVDNILTTENSGEVDVRFVRPKGKNNEVLPLILYVHGGGWIMGDSETHDAFIRKLANCTNSVVAFVNYSRSPESVYPVAVNEVYDVLNYLYSHHSDFNINPEKIIIAGDSAGANMATVVALKSKLENGVKILLQLLLYPVTDSSMDYDSYSEFKSGPWLSKKAMEWFWDSYVPDKKMRKDKFISPVNAQLSELEGAAPAVIIVAQNDVLRDEGEAYALKLIEAGVDTFCVCINNTHHDFLMLNALAKSIPARGALGLISHVLNKVLYH